MRGSIVVCSLWLIVSPICAGVCRGEETRREATIDRLTTFEPWISRSKSGLYEYLMFSGRRALPFPLQKSFDLTAIRELRHLEFPDHQAAESTFQHIGALTRLESLRFGSLAFDCRLKGEWLRHLSGLQRLRALEICSSGLNDKSLEHLANLKSLESIQLDNNWEFSDAAVETLCKIRSLKSLRIYGKFTDRLGPILAAHSRLESLSIAGKFTDQFLYDLARNPRWRELEVRSQAITDAGVKRISASGRLRRLEFDSKQITDAGVAAICRNRKLVDVYLDSPRITDAAVAGLASLPKLDGLALRRSSLTDRGAKDLAASKSIKRLFLEGSSSLTENCIATFRTMPSLSAVDLRSTQIDKPTRDELNRTLRSREKRKSK